MGLVVLCAVLGIAAGLARGGSLAHWSRLRLRGLPVLVAALALQATAALARPGDARLQTVVLSASLVLAAAGAAMDRRAPSVPLALGLVSNALVVAANGAMPVSVSALARAGLEPAAAALGPDPRHEVLGPATRLPWLADVVALPLPLHAEVVSVGDLLVAAGAALLCARATMGAYDDEGVPMAKKSRRRRARAKSKANHGRRPNA